MNIQDSKIIICVGSGGVGKTTVAAAIGVMAAKLGKRVLVLTIDPSLRLAQTLGIHSSEISMVPGQNYSGELFAGIIEHKKIFDDFVIKAAGGEEKAQRIFRNKLYQEMTQGLSGSQEFSALEKLLSCAQSAKYDLIVLDTPPTQHALDFLKAPGQLQALFNEKIAQWFRTAEGGGPGFFQNLIGLGTRQILHVLETLTGREFIHQLSDFFLTIKDWQGYLFNRTVEMQRLLAKNTTSFCLVTSFDGAKLKEAEFFQKEIIQGGYHLRHVVFNRAAPVWVSKDKPVGMSHFEEDLYSRLHAFYQRRDSQMNEFALKFGPEVELIRIHDFMDSLSGLDEIELVSKEMN